MAAIASSRTGTRTVFFLCIVLALASAIFVGLTVLSDGAQTSGTLITASGAHELAVEVADTPQRRETGLMNVTSMPADQGMLFDFEETRDVQMWMKNTYIPLDMLFMDEGGRITHVARNAQPLSLDIISSNGPVRYVLELNGGAARRFEVKPGDRLEHRLIPDMDP